MTVRTRALVTFVGVLIVLRYVFRLRVSILGSLALTVFVWLVVDEILRRRRN
jgi:hypothetical protein